ncbi:MULTISPECIES: hypothetical protein [unclassified Streptomyces]|uniref:hypothetical protein n=1 Tax=unclassified Streptomyces TaxID=2593676 RepID=UPI001BEAAC9C|nr:MULTISPECIES: hypothetical protein [unclassified Streptomyces]MBT2408899.1 hypothetical protein [Streptomyces sp. ISL-21]MBT2612422.1 hypothetical protein [Streptomyces sp. ISL-87]
MVVQQSGGDEDRLDHADAFVCEVLLDSVHVDVRFQQPPARVDPVTDPLCAFWGQPGYAGKELFDSCTWHVRDSVSGSLALAERGARARPASSHPEFGELGALAAGGAAQLDDAGPPP